MLEKVILENIFKNKIFMDKKNKFQSKNIIAISFAHLSHDIYTSFLAPILPLIIQRFGISLSEAGLLDVIRKIPSLLNPLIGIIADRICVRYFVIFGPAITGIAMSLLGVAPNYSILLILLFVTGISSAFFHVPSPVMIKHMAGENIGKGMSFFMLGGEMARTIGPLLITTVISIFGFEGSFRVMPLGIVASIILYIKLKDINIKKDFHKKEKESTMKILKQSKKLIPFFLILTGFLFFQTMIKSSFVFYLPTYLTGKGNTLLIAGASLSILQLSGAVGTFFAGSISDKIGRKKTLLITSIINPILMFAFISSNEFFALPILIIMGFFLFASGPVLLALVQDVDSKSPSFINGVYMTISFIVNSLMVILVGMLGDKIGLEYTYHICAVISTLSIPFVLFLSHKKNDNQNSY